MYSKTIAKNIISGRAKGGPVTAKTPYLVGEKGPEIFTPNVDGSVINNMRTEKIYQMISSGRKGRGGINMINSTTNYKSNATTRNSSSSRTCHRSS